MPIRRGIHQKKAGPNLICEPENIVFLKAMNAYAVTLANNHIGDFGDGAICDTFAILRDNNISYCGAGKNIFDAYKACRIDDGNAKISIISVAV